LSACFIDWEKVPDHVNWKKLMQILKGIGINSRERLTGKLHLDQRVKVQLDREETRKFETGRGLYMFHICALRNIIILM
jgi:hypothetical protein